MTAFRTISIDNDFVFRYHIRHLEARRDVKVPKGSLGHNGITKHILGTEGTKTKQLFGKRAALAGSPFIGIPASHLLHAAAKALGVAQTAEPRIISGSAVIQLDVTAYLGTSVALDLRGYLIPISAGVFILMTLMNP